LDLIIQNIERHIKLSKPEKDYFLSLLKRKIIYRQEFLLEAGQVCKFENFVTKGCMRTYTIDDNGFEHISMFAVEDWWTGELFSFLTQTPATFNIDALEDSVVLQISKPDLELLYLKIPKFERFFRIILQNASISFQRRINQSLSSPADQRYLQFIGQYPQLAGRLSQKQIASCLGIIPEFLSMVRRKPAKK
jgi:CRP-like cAMP-binding protein